MAGLTPFVLIFGGVVGVVAALIVYGICLEFKVPRYLRIALMVLIVGASFVFFHLMEVSENKEVLERQKRQNTWLTDMQNAGCKRTGYATTRYDIRPVWTCPDGQAYLQ